MSKGGLASCPREAGLAARPGGYREAGPLPRQVLKPWHVHCSFTDYPADSAASVGGNAVRDYRLYWVDGEHLLPLPYEFEAPDDATAVERLVAFLGRDPRWRPSRD